MFTYSLANISLTSIGGIVTEPRSRQMVDTAVGHPSRAAVPDLDPLPLRENCGRVAVVLRKRGDRG